MISLPGIILIDDDIDQLNSIRESFTKIGLPCLPVQYINDYTNQSGIDHICFDKVTPRIVITDLNLVEAANLSSKDLAGPIMNLLQKLNIAGPYILYFWSKNAGLVESVIKIIQERIENKKLLPISWGILDKTNLLGNPESLKIEIDKIINDDSIFSSMFNWENRINNAAQETINSLYEMTRPNDSIEGGEYAPSHVALLQDVLTIIANETLGPKNALSFPSEAVDQGLLPVLNDRLQNIDRGSHNWKKSLPNIGEKVTIDESMKAKLNSFYHIEKIEKDYPKNHRGVFIPLSSEYISDDANLKKICSKLGVASIDEILYSEFIDETKIQKENLMDNLKEISLGFVELSAECDHAQKKTKLHRYLVAALIPEKLIGHCTFGKKNTKHEGIYRVPSFYLENERYILKLSFKYQIGTKDKFIINSQEFNHKWFGNPLFRLRDQILSDITFKCSQYISRPGIVSFY